MLFGSVRACTAVVDLVNGDDGRGDEAVEAAGSTATTAPPIARVPDGPPAAERRLTLDQTIGGEISPKSVVASNTGLVFAQNMMYHHTVTVYSSEGDPVETIPDSVDLAAFGVEGGATVQGAPVEGALSPDGRHYWVSNYSMYGPGQGPEGDDDCTPASAQAGGYTPSYLYRIDVDSLTIDDVVQVGLVPKYVATTPDGRYVLATNWCSWDLSVVSTDTNELVATIPLDGPYPRGIAVSPDSSTAYVAMMGETRLVQVDLESLTVTGSFEVGAGPRHVVIAPEGDFLYVSLNAAGSVVKVDAATGAVVATVPTGAEARSLAISNDGTALYVVNYESNTMTALRASDLGVIEEIPTGVHPIGVTYDGVTGDVWVAVYTGEILRFRST